MVEHLSEPEVDFLLRCVPYPSDALPPAGDLNALEGAGLIRAAKVGPGTNFILTAEGWVRLLSDADLRKAYLGTDGEPENEVADLLAAECERRNIDL
ncbi:hypothetical protein [Sphingomonas aerophila]|uniref:Uncharacterized protein n=1 Tax=Sphingomonas aerophila TaxID=1344948 RepID=A0A7W9BCS2_9SPHN|nr:hypothetical protein [Sphingomonas aerophila]MBB5714782.1 hypothetical protein [Sphingomonas aerophila]